MPLKAWWEDGFEKINDSLVLLTTIFMFENIYNFYTNMFCLFAFKFSSTIVLLSWIEKILFSFVLFKYFKFICCLSACAQNELTLDKSERKCVIEL